MNASIQTTSASTIRRRLIAASSALVLTLSISACGGGDSNGPDSNGSGNDVVRVADYGPDTGFSWMTKFAIAKGFFAQNQIDAKERVITSSPLAMAGLASHSVEVAEASVMSTLPGISKGQEIKLISGETRNIWAFMAAKDTKLSSEWPTWIHELKGKSIGVTTLGSAGYFMTRAMLAAGGLDPDDVKYYAIGEGGPALAATLDAGKVDAEMSDYPSIAISKTHGARILLDLTAPLPKNNPFPDGINDIAGAPYLGAYANSEWIDEHPDVVKRYQLSLMEATCYINKPENRDVFAKFIQGIGGVPTQFSGKAATDYVYDAMKFTTVFPKDMAETWNEFALKYGVVKKSTPVEDWRADTVPNSDAEVSQRIQDAGGSCELPSK